MANTDSAFGLRPVRYHSSGKPYTGAANPYFATGSTGVIHRGDPVIATGNANTAAFGGYEKGFLPTCGLATAGDTNAITGVCVAVLPVTRESKVYRENSTDRIIMVADDPDLVFQVQDDGDGTLTTADIGLFANLASATGDVNVGISRWELDGSDPPANDYSNQVLLIGYARNPGNEADSDYAVWEVLINQHQLTVGPLNSNMGRFLHT